jgi:hypothetical protein
MSRFFSVLYHESIVGLCSDQHNDYLLLEKKLKDLKPDQIGVVVATQKKTTLRQLKIYSFQRCVSNKDSILINDDANFSGCGYIV